ncbi:hypothetical protein TKK_0017510 [Trichogramma kaykai]|uniref:Peptidase S1 domain-containing protein n=1 Tax=Trichogramma kaykai TaxID=54128 RepID=A0ABD2W2U5_9HYME
MEKLLLSLFFGLILSITVSNVSARTKIAPRIIGGQFAPTRRFLHQVSLQLIGKGCSFHQCGGSIIDSMHIITAAHCVTDKSTYKLNNLPITIVAGANDLRDKRAGIYRDVEYTYIPKSYSSNFPGYYYDDIAILRLKHPLPLGKDPRIKQINLPWDDNRYEPARAQNLVVSGFGTYKQNRNPYNGQVESGPTSPRLKYASGLITHNDDPPCTYKQVCVRNTNFHGSCYGDSGGPLIDESRRTLIGLVSYSNHEWCGDTTKYTRVSSYLDFINKVRAGGWFSSDNISTVYNEFNNEQIMPTLPHCDQLSEK